MTPQTIARIFFLIGCLGLPFALFGLYVFGGLFVANPSADTFVNVGVFVLVMVAGIFLFVGYLRRMRGRPFRLSPVLLWQATIVYNTVGLIASVLLYWPFALFYLALIALATVAYRAEVAAQPTA
ncbi:MAG: hypothetical protein HKN04_15385 [Rhodothermaceae bacterium]|nr:hypothetical protein [Rhodothermaceae bacterium]